MGDSKEVGLREHCYEIIETIAGVYANEKVSTARERVMKEKENGIAK